MPLSSLEHKIQQLCAQAISTEDPAQLQPILSDLRAALSEQLNRVNRMVSERALRSLRRNQPPPNPETSSPET